MISRNFLSVMMVFCACFAIERANAASGETCRAVFISASISEQAGKGYPSEAIIRNVLDQEANEKLTVKLMSLVAEQKRKNADTIDGWVRSIRETVVDSPPSVMEHAALMFMYQNRILDDGAHPSALRSLEESLEISYSHLSGNKDQQGDWRSPLPRSVVDRAGETAREFHNAVFDEAAVLRGGSGPKSWLARLRSRVGIDNCVTGVTSILATVGMFFEPTRPYAGLLLGLAQASLNEHLIHIGIGHAGQKLGKAFRHYGGTAGLFAEQIAMTHKLHHAITKQNFGAVVLTPEQRDMAEKTLLKLSERLVFDRIKEKRPELSDAEIEALPEFASEVDRIVTATRSGNYGINGTWMGATSMLATNAPWYLLNLSLYAATGSEAFLVTSNASLVIMTLQSLYSHRYLHIRPSDRHLVPTNWLQNLYMNSPFGRLQQRLHFVHHESPYGIDSTQNGAIMAGSVSDRLMFDLHRPSVKNLIDYYFQGFLPYMQSQLPQRSGEKPRE